VGPNGAGKTTLLRALAGEAVLDGGRLEIEGNPTLGYLPQDLAEIPSGTVLEALKKRTGIGALEGSLATVEAEIASLRPGSGGAGALYAEHDRLQREYQARDGYRFEAEAARVLDGLGFEPGDWARPASEFSGGWKMRLLLAALLLARPEVLLLDEPTNHMDAESLEFLEGWLARWKGTLIVASHDRRFLEKTAERIDEMDRGRIETYACGFARYLEERVGRIERIEAEEGRRREEAQAIRDFADRFRYKATKARQAQSRLKKLERLESAPLPTTPQTARRVAIRFPEAPRSPLVVVRAQGLGHRYDHWVFREGDFEIQRGDRVALVGRNGAGKSTLLRLVCGLETPVEGSLRLGEGVLTARFAQESEENLSYARTVFQEVRAADTRPTDAEIRDLLGAFLFSGDEADKPIAGLSGGEKSRLTMAKLLLSRSNLLVLDEPTNHLDETTKERLCEALSAYGGTLLLVAHDRHFLDRLATRVLEIREGRIRTYEGNYSDYIASRSAREAEEAAQGSAGEGQGASRRAAETAPASARDAERERRRAEAEERNALYRARRVVLDELEPLEARIGELEARLRELDGLLADPAVLADSERVRDLMKERGRRDRELTAALPRWEELSLRLEEIGREE
jgi:ATP-binding cassette subfamily F protein 3